MDTRMRSQEGMDITQFVKMSMNPAISTPIQTEKKC